MGDGMQMQCLNHPHTNNNNNSCGGGICALCLQDKLRNLVSSPSPSSFPSPPLSSSSPSFTPPTSSSLQTHHTRSRLPTFLVPNKNIIINNNNNKSPNINIILKRSKSTAAPRKRNGFWSFLYPPYSSNKNNKCPQEKKSDHVINITEEEDKYCFTSSSPNKVSRSRSVGCGSRSFSLADCTLRRVESQRQPKVTASSTSSSSSVTHCMKERVRCGGIFGAFLITSSSSSSTTSSSSLDDARGKAWAWAFASPMRPFTNKPSSSSSSTNKRDASHNKNATSNLSAIPSLLTVRA